MEASVESCLLSATGSGAQVGKARQLPIFTTQDLAGLTAVTITKGASRWGSTCSNPARSA